MSLEVIFSKLLADELAPLKQDLAKALKALENKDCADDSSEDWIRPGRARRMLDVDVKTLDKYVKCGFLTPCFLPGDGRKDRRFIRREIEELKKSNALPKYSRK